MMPARDALVGFQHFYFVSKSLSSKNVSCKAMLILYYSSSSFEYKTTHASYLQSNANFSAIRQVCCYYETVDTCSLLGSLYCLRSTFK